MKNISLYRIWTTVTGYIRLRCLTDWRRLMFVRADDALSKGTLQATNMYRVRPHGMAIHYHFPVLGRDHLLLIQEANLMIAVQNVLQDSSGGNFSNFS